MEHESTPVVALERAIRFAGSQAAFARLVGVTQQAVSRWISKAKPLPHMHVLKVEAETGISRHDLRPDLYPNEERVEARVHAHAPNNDVGGMEPAR